MGSVAPQAPGRDTCHPPPQASEPQGRGARSARTRAAPFANEWRGEEGGWFSCCVLLLYRPRSRSQKTPRGVCSTPANNRRSGYDSFTPRNSAFPGAQERRSLCSADKDLDARLPGQSRRSGVPAPLYRFRGCWVRDTSADPDHVRLGPQTVPLSLPEPCRTLAEST